MVPEQKTDLLSLDDLKRINPLQGFLLYTNAGESGVVRNGVRYLEGPPGVDQVLIDVGYAFIPELARPDIEMFWMEKEIEGRKERIRYHPLAEGDPQKVRDLELRTRVNFVGSGPSDAVYEVARALVERGYSVVVPPLNRFMDRLFQLTSEEGEHKSKMVPLE